MVTNWPPEVPPEELSEMCSSLVVNRMLAADLSHRLCSSTRDSAEVEHFSSFHSQLDSSIVSNANYPGDDPVHEELTGTTGSRASEGAFHEPSVVIA